MGLLRSVILFKLWCLIILGVTKGQHRDRGRGAYIGDIVTLQHEVSGSVWAIDEDTFYIEGFKYDGRGPDAFFWVGNGTQQPTPQGTIVPYPTDSFGRTQRQLPRFTGKNLILHLPPYSKITDLSWFSVWCRRFTVDFGHVLIPPNLDPPKKRILPEFKRLAHQVRSGNVTILDAKTFYIPNLHYDGTGPDAFFWVGSGYEPNQLGQKVPNEVGGYEVLRGYEGEDIEIQLPANLTVYDIDYLAIWCVEYRHNFGHVLIPEAKDLWVPPALGQTRIKPVSIPPYQRPSFIVPSLPVPEDNNDIYGVIQPQLLLPTQLSNCRQIHDDLQVEWEATEEAVQIRLVGRISEEQYMAFGLSPIQEKPQMLHSDIVVAYYDDRDASYHAVDYSITAIMPCDRSEGVCPDERLNGRNDVQVIDGSRTDGVTSVTFSRPFETSDRRDIAIDAQSGPVTVIAAIGDLNSRKEAIYHNAFVTKDKITIDFGSVAENGCSSAKGATKRPVVFEPWPANIIRGVFNFTANIGPTGGDRGYKAITGSSSWGVSWWINELLIPEIYVERGQTYYFTIEGGSSENNPARNHPFYITGDSEGGFGQKTPDDQTKETVYAGVAYTKMGTPHDIGSGRLCEWQHRGVDSWRESATFKEYKRTLHKSCEPGQAGRLMWTVQPNTPDLVYYQCYTHRNLGWKIHVTDQGFNLAQSLAQPLIPGPGSLRLLAIFMVIYFNQR